MKNVYQITFESADGNKRGFSWFHGNAWDAVTTALKEAGEKGRGSDLKWLCVDIHKI